MDEAPTAPSETWWVGVDQVEGGSFFDDASVDHVPSIALFDAAVRAASTMLGRLDEQRSASCVSSVEVTFPGLCRRGVPADLRLGSPEFQRGSSSVRFHLAQGKADVCVGRVVMAHADNSELLAPWIVSLGRRAEHVLLGKGASWRVLVGPPRRTEDGCLTTDMVGPSAPSDMGVHPVSLVVEAASQIASIAARVQHGAGKSARLIVSSVELSLLADEPWESYPELICYDSELIGQQLTATIGLRVDGVPMGGLRVVGKVLSPVSHHRMSAALVGNGVRGRG